MLAALAVGIVAIVALKIGRAQRLQPRAQARAAAPVALAELPSPTAPAAAPPVRGVTDNEIRFGMAAPFSGPAKELGRQMKMGLEAAFNAVNDAGGIAGRRLILVAADDGYEPARTVEVMKALRDKNDVFGFVGNVGTPTAAVALPVALERKMLFFGAFTGANLLRHDPPDRYVFNFRASYTEETAAVVRYLIKVRHLRPESIAVFAQQDAFGDAGFAGVTRAVRELRPDFRGTLRVGYQRNTTDVREAVATLNARSRSTPIKAIVMVATYRAAAHFIEKVRDLFPKMIFTNVSFVGSTALAEELKLLGHRYASGVIVTQVVPPVERFSTAILKYKDALNRYFPGEKADYVSLEGFWVANVLIEGVRRAGRDIDSERLVDALEGIHDLDLGLGTPLTFGLEEHQASHRVWGTQINNDGAYEEIDLK
jgi:ABC-type branched-subunit amino acid transport system substrate-binding protein